jgi:hypothetical protein
MAAGVLLDGVDHEEDGQTLSSKQGVARFLLQACLEGWTAKALCVAGHQPCLAQFWPPTYPLLPPPLHPLPPLCRLASWRAA